MKTDSLMMKNCDWGLDPDGSHDRRNNIRQRKRTGTNHDRNAMTDSIYQSENPFVPSVTGEVAGDINKNIRTLDRIEHQIVENNRNRKRCCRNYNRISKKSSIKISVRIEFQMFGRLQRRPKKPLLSQPFSKEEGMDLIQRIGIYHYHRIIRGTVQWEGIYFVIDIDQFLKRLGIDKQKYQPKQTDTKSNKQKKKNTN